MRTASTINNTAILADNKLQVVHIRNVAEGGRDMTIAFRPPHGKEYNLEIATSIVHPRDSFDRKIGTKLAAEAFLAGRTIRVPRDPTFETVANQLTFMFKVEAF